MTFTPELEPDGKIRRISGQLELVPDIRFIPTVYYLYISGMHE